MVVAEMTQWHRSGRAERADRCLCVGGEVDPNVEGLLCGGCCFGSAVGALTWFPANSAEEILSAIVLFHS